MSAGPGWRRFPAEPAVLDWVGSVRDAALATARDPAHAHWHRHGQTWFAGVNVLANDALGRVGDGPALSGAAVAHINAALGGALPFDRAQVSICQPGYPRRDAGASEAAHRFRRQRDAAHVDGLKPEGPARRRVPAEFHAYILGLPLTRAAPGASPLVVYQGSHRIMADALAPLLRGRDPAHWPAVDVTAAYHAARRRCLEHCPRVALPASPGEALLLHRLCLHGVAPWAEGAAADPAGRAIAYFRPALAAVTDWPEIGRVTLP